MSQVILGVKERINEVMLNETEYVHQFVCFMVKKEESIVAGKKKRGACITLRSTNKI